MSDHKTLREGISNAAWGFFFLHFNVRLGNVSILPDFVGYLLLLSAIGHLEGGRRELGLLRPLGRLLMACSLAEWGLSWFGMQLSGHVLFLDLILAAVGIYFRFQLITDLAALAQAVQPAGETISQRLLRRRTQNIVLATAVAVLPGLPLDQRLEYWQGGLLTVLAAACLVVAVAIMLLLFELRRCITEQPEACG